MQNLSYKRKVTTDISFIELFSAMHETKVYCQKSNNANVEVLNCITIETYINKFISYQYDVGSEFHIQHALENPFFQLETLLLNRFSSFTYSCKSNFASRQSRLSDDLTASPGRVAAQEGDLSWAADTKYRNVALLPAPASCPEPAPLLHV